MGIIMAVGNVGSQLEKNKDDRMNTYLSRDGGMNWAEVRKGPYVYEVGDHGGIIVMAKNTQPTTTLIYSYNEGKSWHELEISQVPLDITNIIIEPESITQQFVVYGSFQDANTPGKTRGVIVTLDFSQLHGPQCKGADRPGDSDSDYELWTPFDGRHGNSKCFMG